MKLSKASSRVELMLPVDNAANNLILAKTLDTPDIEFKMHVIVRDAGLSKANWLSKHILYVCTSLAIATRR